VQGHKKMVLDGVIAYFVDQDAKLAAASAQQTRLVKGNKLCAEMPVILDF
jgi:hypothetical protein